MGNDIKICPLPFLSLHNNKGHETNDAGTSTAILSMKNKYRTIILLATKIHQITSHEILQWYLSIHIPNPNTCCTETG
jgi:hypothetical protein